MRQKQVKRAPGVSDWRPGIALEALRARAELYQHIRAFFAARGYLEVDPPLLGRGGTTDPAIESFQTRCSSETCCSGDTDCGGDTECAGETCCSGNTDCPGDMDCSGDTGCSGETLYLQTSPEFFMKRLLAAGSGPIYAISKVFRQGEQGRHHNPEFTLLEWYRPGFDDHALMAEIGELLGGLLNAPVKKQSYRQSFWQHLSLDPHAASLTDLKRCARQHITVDWDDDNRDVWLDLLFSHLIQPKLHGSVTLIHDYPASQAALAKITRDTEGQNVARRFEAFFVGIELANGYWELTDATEQAQRFTADNNRRRATGLAPVQPDTKLIAALKAGMPNCAGVALGLDRLLMLTTGQNSLKDVIAFPWPRL